MPTNGPFNVFLADSESDDMLEEYQAKSEAKTTECYVESTAGKGFKVVIKLRENISPTTVYCIKVFVDGRCNDAVAKALGNAGGWISSTVVSGARVNNETIAPFRFGETKFTGWRLI